MYSEKTAVALRAIALGAVAIAASLGSAAVAQPSSQIDVSGKAGAGAITREIAVVTRDLNLKDARGQARLDSRLQTASARVCDGVGATWIRPPRDYQRCYGEALEGARGQVAQRLASGDTAAIRVASR